MKRSALVVATAVLVLGSTVAPARAAGTHTSPRTHAQTPVTFLITADDTATVNRAGSMVVWPVAFVCPRHERYTLDGFLSEFNSDAPWDDGGDVGVDAGTFGSVDARGRCTGREQTRDLHLRVQPHDGLFWPLSPSPYITSQVTIQTPTSTAFDCGGPACAESTGTRVTVVPR